MIDRWRWGSAESAGSGESVERESPHPDGLPGQPPHAIRKRRVSPLGALAAAGIFGSASCGAVAIYYQQLATAEQKAASRAETANADLQTMLSRLRDQLGESSQALLAAQRRLGEQSDDARNKIAASEQAASSRADRIAQLTRALEQAKRELHLSEAQQATLLARLNKSQMDAAKDQARKLQQVQADQDELEKKVQQLASDRDRAAGERNRLTTERDRLRARVGVLEQKLSLLQTRQPPRPVASASPAAPARAAAPVVAAAPAVPAAVGAQPAASAPTLAAVAAPRPMLQETRPAAPAAIPAVAHGGIAQFERVLASAGLDVKHLFSQYGVNRGEGGPFIPAPRGAQPAPVPAEKLAALHRMVNSLPVSAPLQSYQISSRFGVRGDPVNGRASLHTGTDLRAPYMSPVYAAAGGVVTFSGYRDDYGRIVEIDHGNGLTTRYGHLHRTTVSVGQKVPAHAQIGFLGSSGRATGPHVHYEVLVNGEPQDPEKFLGLARVLSVVASR